MGLVVNHLWGSIQLPSRKSFDKRNAVFAYLFYHLTFRPSQLWLKLSMHEIH